MKKLISMLLVLSMATSLTGALALERKAAYTNGQFEDVKSSDWYAPAVKGVCEYGLMVGTSENTFSPIKNITAPEIYLLMARFCDLLNGGNGVIQGEDWTTSGKNYLAEQGKAIELQEDEQGFVSRCYIIGQLAQIVNVADFKVLNMVVSVPDVDINTPYSAEILQLYKAGILTGADAYGTFNPWANISRAELAAILVRVLDEKERVSFTLKEVPASPIGGDPTDRDMREMPHVAAFIEKYSGHINDQISGQLLLGVSGGEGQYGYDTELYIYEADHGYFLQGLDFDPNDKPWNVQKELINALMTDAFGADIAQKVMNYLDERSLALATGYSPEIGLSETGYKWVEQHDEKTFYFDGMALTWSRYCNDVEIRKNK